MSGAPRKDVFKGVLRDTANEGDATEMFPRVFVARTKRWALDKDGQRMQADRGEPRFLDGENKALIVLPAFKNPRYTQASHRASGVLRHGVAREIDEQDVPIRVIEQRINDNIENILPKWVLGADKKRFGLTVEWPEEHGDRFFQEFEALRLLVRR